jgi:folate-binding protein YgfZ
VLDRVGAPLPAGTDGAYASGSLPGGGLVRRMPWPGTDAADLLVPRADKDAWLARLAAAGARPAGTMAFEALRVEALAPRLHLDTDDRTIPHEVGWIPSAVHLTKGCYRGQETVARVANLGRPRAGWCCCTWTPATRSCRLRATRCSGTGAPSAASVPWCSTTSSARSRWRW